MHVLEAHPTEQVLASTAPRRVLTIHLPRPADGARAALPGADVGRNAARVHLAFPRLFLALAVLAFAACSAPLSAQTTTSKVVVKVSEVRNTNGKVVIGIWKSADGFPKESSKAFRLVSVEIVDGTATTTFTDLPHGEYAVAAYHDENGNGKLDTRFPGVPTEGTGVSNNVKTRFSAPAFSDCRFDLHDPEKTLSIKLLY